jgi:RimJ/RimL family protein N-acetyltransferase
MNIEIPLFEGKQICLAPIDHEKDAEIESRWTHDAEFMRMLSPGLARPYSPFQLKKKYEEIEKNAEEGNRLFYFTIRLRADDRLVGFGKLAWIDWSNGSCFIQLGIGDPADRGCGYGAEALRLLMRFAFEELSLYRLWALVPEYNQRALSLFTKVGFVEEARRRQALNRDGRRWDLFHLSLLRPEWEALQVA